MAGLDAYNAAATAMGGRGIGSQASTSDQLLGTLRMGLVASDGPSPLMAGIPGQPMHLRCYMTGNYIQWSDHSKAAALWQTLPMAMLKFQTL